MKYSSFEEGLKALASHQTGDNAFFGSLEVGLTKAHGQQIPYVKLENHILEMNAQESRQLKHITIDFEKFPSKSTKHAMRIEFIKCGDQWQIDRLDSTPGLPSVATRYDEQTRLWTRSEDSQPSSDTTFSLYNWRVSKLDIVKDNNSIGTILPGERAYCGPSGIRNVDFFRHSAVGSPDVLSK